MREGATEKTASGSRRARSRSAHGFYSSQDSNPGLPWEGTGHVWETRSVRFKQERMSLDKTVTGRLGWG